MSLFEGVDAVWGAWRALRSTDTGTAAGFAAMLETCLASEVHWVDHADIYSDGAVESLHGEACARLAPASAQALRIISKCGVRFPSAGQPGVRVQHYRSDAAYLVAQAESSLRRLRADSIDLYLLHRPDYLMRVEETAAALEQLVASGKIKAYGVSNFSPPQLDRLAVVAPDIAAHQFELSPLATACLDNGLMDQVQTRAIPVLAWSPLAGGQLFREGPLQAVLKRIGEDRGVADIAAVALSWVSGCGAGVVPIIGTTQPNRLVSQITGMRSLELDVQDWYEILQAGRGQPVP